MCEAPSAFSASNRKARKEHVCVECRETITAGTHYRYTSGIWNGEPESYKHCLPCAKIMDGAVAYDYENGGDGVGIGDLRNWFFGFMCIDFKGQEFVIQMSQQTNVSAENLNRLLKIDFEDDSNG